MLRKVREDKALVLLIAPVWTTQSWYPVLLQLLIDQPIVLPKGDTLLSLPHGNAHHPMKDDLVLAAWILSSNPLETEVFSNEEARLICASWSSGTDKQYNSAWKKWCCWCNKRQIDMLQAPIDQMANFLSESFAAGKSYSTINTYRSALSLTLYPFNNSAVGTHPLIVRLVKGVYNERPPAPRYSTTWDVTKVTDYLKTLFPLDQLNLKTLTLKTVMLCALSSAQREQTLCALDLNCTRETLDGFSFVIAERLKTSKPGKSVTLKFDCLPDKTLCTKCTLAAYISRTKALRGHGPNDFVSKLFISYIKPHKPISTDTLSRWIKLVLASAGIDTSVFKTHSVRGAATSHAYAKSVPIAEILRAADWTNERTFRKYYLRQCNP